MPSSPRRPRPPTALPRGRRARRTAPSLVVLLVLVVVTAACTGSGGEATLVSPSSSAAAHRLDRAASAMRQVAGYRFVATVGTGPSQVHLSGEFEAPDRVHENITLAGQAPVEV